MSPSPSKPNQIDWYAKRAAVAGVYSLSGEYLRRKKTSWTNGNVLEIHLELFLVADTSKDFQDTWVLHLPPLLFDLIPQKIHRFIPIFHLVYFIQYNSFTFFLRRTTDGRTRERHTSALQISPSDPLDATIPTDITAIDHSD